MKNGEIKKKVKEFRREYNVKEISSDSLETIFIKQGFTIIEYNPVINDPDVTTVIQNLGLTDMIAHSNGFLYVDSNYRLVFINEKLNDTEKVILYAHEEGHYYCGHTKAITVVGRTVQEEYEANEFAHYLLQKSLLEKAKDLIPKYKKQVTIGALLLFLVLGSCVAAKEYHDRMLYMGDYYITEHGEKYHRRTCVTLQDHEVRRLTKEDVKTGNYEPCSVCQPDK